jgi:hypothetical protein
VPTSFTAAILNTYANPFVKPVTVVDVAAEVPSLKVVHEEPALLEN